jgi:hypothetical protein
VNFHALNGELAEVFTCLMVVFAAKIKPKMTVGRSEKD